MKVQNWSNNFYFLILSKNIINFQVWLSNILNRYKSISPIVLNVLIKFTLPILLLHHCFPQIYKLTNETGKHLTIVNEVLSSLSYNLSRTWLLYAVFLSLKVNWKRYRTWITYCVVVVLVAHFQQQKMCHQIKWFVTFPFQGDLLLPLLMLLLLLYIVHTATILYCQKCFIFLRNPFYVCQSHAGGMATNCRVPYGPTIAGLAWNMSVTAIRTCCRHGYCLLWPYLTS